ncbi:hypothetical protein ONA22_04990 [Mycoplasmopsis cynos]|uniref:hypothetical protein n=1 Tax=Mycoplasmopsis cynos TaxID=171284 RepID=UPI0024CBCCD0|nr:hypothetical protein [Mycoplasmopsis cynos]WAM03115.1 hypothetical protein ONA22_04990 [Mycoplasmopsis cynos]
MIKYKENISKTSFYIYLQIALLTLALFVWIMIPFGLGIRSEEFLKITKNLSNEQINKLGYEITTKTVLSYIANTLVILFFVGYLLILRNKLKYGYFFIISWIVIFITIAFVPFYGGIKYHPNIQIIFGGIISTISITIILHLVLILFNFYIKRKFHYYEFYKIHKERANKYEWT